MEDGRTYTTIGAVYDFLIEKHQGKGGAAVFRSVLDELDKQGMLMAHKPEIPAFHSGMDLREFTEFVLGLPLRADGILAHGKCGLNDPLIEEAELFPMGRDVFSMLNMPYMVKVLHFHNFFEITYVIRGKCSFLFEGETVPLNEGDVCIVSPMSGHSLPMEPGCLALSIVVRRSTFDSVFSNLLAKKDLLSLFFRNSLYETRRANYILLKTGSDPMTLHAMQELVYECNMTDDNANTCAISLLNLYLARALRAANAAITLRHYEGYAERDFNFTLVLQYIQQNYRTVTLSSLAETFHFSETYLSKLIRKRMNQSFTEVLRTLKMNHALEYLVNTSMKVSEIADAVGYDSVDHFSRTFRKVYGVAPQEYKKTLAAEQPSGGKRKKETADDTETV